MAAGRVFSWILLILASPVDGDRGGGKERKGEVESNCSGWSGWNGWMNDDGVKVEEMVEGVRP